ncbi:hypothetical protein LTR10_000096 [Elasticomyces elasticus]|nr:hypothetical protein LTR10_000096 [Elasticomyces elasticus]
MYYHARTPTEVGATSASTIPHLPLPFLTATIMSRLPPLPRSELPPAQQQAHDDLTAFAMSAFGTAFSYTRKEDDALLGPFPFYIQTPEIGLDTLGLLAKFSKLGGLSVEARETAVLAVGSVFQAGYELYAHERVALKATTLSQEQLECICSGGKPKDLGEDCQAAYDVATHLAKHPGPLPQELWDRSMKALGKEGTVALVHYVGFYAYICIVLNAIDEPVPKD